MESRIGSVLLEGNVGKDINGLLNGAKRDVRGAVCRASLYAGFGHHSDNILRRIQQMSSYACRNVAVSGCS
jgi:hypothetical protein